MPIALLLAEIQKRRREWMPMLADWSRLLATEELLWRRARGAFLRKWFGPGLQMEGTGLLVVVQNIDVLKSQLLFARAESASDVNLMEPVMGMLGGLVGGVVGVILGFFLPWAPVGIPVTLAVIGGVIGLAGIGFGLWAQTDPRFQAGFRASAALARMVEELLTFWGWITGPRNEIKNLTIRTALDVLDKVAVTTGQLTGIVALFFTRVVPWLWRLAYIARPFYDLVMSVVEYLKFVWRDLMSKLRDLLGGPNSPLTVVHRMIALLCRIPAVFTHGFDQMLKQLIVGVTQAAATVEAHATRWLDGITTILEDALDASPVVRLFKTAGDTFTTISAVLAAHYPRIADFLSKPGVFGKALKWVGRQIPGATPDMGEVERRVAALGSRPPTPGMWEEWWRLRDQGLMPDLYDFFERGFLNVTQSGELPTIFSVGSQLSRDLRDGLNAPLPNAFADERRKLREEAGGPPRRRLLELHNEEVTQYRDLIASVIDRMMPASAAGVFAALEPMLNRLDEELRVEKPDPHARPGSMKFRSSAARFPALDVREEDRLRLEVPVLRVHYRGPKEEDTNRTIRTFATDLRAAWIGQEYLLPSAS